MHKALDFIPCTAIKSSIPSQIPWLTPVILSTQEAELRRSAVQSQFGQIIPKTLFCKITHHKKEKRPTGRVGHVVRVLT
jgi:hypothetical protein